MTARELTIAAFAALAVAAGVLYVAGRLRRLGLVPLGEVVTRVRASLPGRLVLAVGWAWLGWHLLAR
jgi:hypothetical protein